jgi:hypothetical protein
MPGLGLRVECPIPGMVWSCERVGARPEVADSLGAP